MIEPTASYVPAEEILCRELAGEMVLLDVPSATYFSLNETGTRVWHLMETRATVEEVCQALAKEDDITPEHMMRELIPFVEQLLETGLIRPAP